MTYATGAAACLKLGRHQWRTGGAGWRDCDVCARCGQARARRFTDDQIDQFDARDAARDYVRAEAEAHDDCSGSERDVRSHAEER